MVKFNNSITNGPLSIYTIRHGQSTGNARGLDDVSLQNTPNHQFPLTSKGKKEISSTTEYMVNQQLLSPGMPVYTSTFKRAQESVEIIIKQFRPGNLTVDSRLDEWWKGIYHSLSSTCRNKHYPLEDKILTREGWYHYRPPQGLAGKDVENNLLSFINELPPRKICIVGHGRSIAFLRRLLTNQPLDLDCNYPYPSNAELWYFKKNEEYYNYESLYKP